MMNALASHLLQENQPDDSSLWRRSEAGFSFTELLAVIIIMLLVSVIMANGIPAARTAYNRVVDASNAHVLMATTVTRLRDELSSADLSASVDDSPTGKGELVSFVSMRTGYRTTLAWDTENGVLKKEAAAGEGYPNPNSTEPVPLVQPTAGKGAVDSMHVEVDTIKYEDGMFTVSDLKVMKDDDEVISVHIPKLEIRVLTPVYA